MARPLHHWTDEHYQFLADNIKGTPYKELHKMINAHFSLNLTFSQVIGAINRRDLTNGIVMNFQKGHTPFNKGWKGWQAGGNAKKTQFKKGRISENHRPVGSERTDTKDGYVLIKVAEPNVWDLKHRHIWREAGREIPEGYALIFADGDRTNVSLDNLMLVTRRQLAVVNKNGLLFNDRQLNQSGLLMADLLMKVSELAK